ncbi:hypothetical protein LSH36_356g02008 [Paralvinella palmiformis]|uniref:Cytosol aminopeptidase domain-containing protein n=1 Tax=Paralvinella palmiformis TaxID=53620 RepID=A0AAD9N1J1_9ANNE|nr:hypothetical protein LSH36_356g02008 [Paralvinella palmiformis]
MKGLVLGIYKGEKGDEFSLTKATQSFQESRANKLSELIRISGLSENGTERIFYGLDSEYTNVAIVSLGKKDSGYNELEELDEDRENIRAGIAVTLSIKSAWSRGTTLAEGQLLAKYMMEAPANVMTPTKFAEVASEKLGKLDKVKVYISGGISIKPSAGMEDMRADMGGAACVLGAIYTAARLAIPINVIAWSRGTTLAEGQLLAKYMMEAPANVMTPTKFAEVASEKLGKLDKVKVYIRDKAWAEEKKMGSFLSVTKGSSEPPKFVEIHYNGLMPLCENMPSGSASKPGDVVTAMNGKTIQINNTDAEGQLILADALVYAETFKPRGIIDLATLTGGIIVALGTVAAGVFTNSTTFWEAIHKVGMRTGDRVWRMPLFQHFSKQVTECRLADVRNILPDGFWSPCSAAAFLRVDQPGHLWNS